jgi:hypothetical protein
MAEATDVRVPHRLHRPLRQLANGHALASVDARLHPVELGEDIVRQVQRPIPQDVALDTAQDAEGR